MVALMARFGEWQLVAQLAMIMVDSMEQQQDTKTADNQARMPAVWMVLLKVVKMVFDQEICQVVLKAGVLVEQMVSFVVELTVDVQVLKSVGGQGGGLVVLLAGMWEGVMVDELDVDKVVWME